jgi:hypothetical protein
VYCGRPFLIWVLCALLATAFFGTGIDSDELPMWQWTLGVVFITGEVLIPLGAVFLVSRQLMRRLRRRR